MWEVLDDTAVSTFGLSDLLSDASPLILASAILVGDPKRRVLIPGYRISHEQKVYIKKAYYKILRDNNTHYFEDIEKIKVNPKPNITRRDIGNRAIFFAKDITNQKDICYDNPSRTIPIPIIYYPAYIVTEKQWYMTESGSLIDIGAEEEAYIEKWPDEDDDYYMRKHLMEWAAKDGNNAPAAAAVPWERGWERGRPPGGGGNRKSNRHRKSNRRR